MDSVFLQIIVLNFLYLVYSRDRDVAEHFLVLAGVPHFVAGFADFSKTQNF